MEYTNYTIIVGRKSGIVGIPSVMISAYSTFGQTYLEREIIVHQYIIPKNNITSSISRLGY
jgi:hypothetical protein